MGIINEIQSYRIKALVERASLGDERAFADLVREFQRGVWRFILMWVHNASDAEELTQETFIVAWRSLPHFRGESAFSTWLLGIALNIARNHHNRSPSRREVELPDEGGLDALLPQDDDPSDLLERKEVLMALSRAISELPDELRAVVILVRLEELSLEETAATLRVPLGTVKSRLSRARERLTRDVAAHQL